MRLSSQDMTPGARKDADVTEVFHERALSDSSPLRKIIDPFAPVRKCAGEKPSRLVSYASGDANREKYV